VNVPSYPAEGASLAPVRVLVVDDHEIVRSGLAAFLLAIPDMVLVGTARNGLEALRQCEQLRPDVVLMDLAMPMMDGVAATAGIRAAHPGIQVIVLTSFKEQELVRQALEAGAIGYLLKDLGVEELATAIRNAHAGKPTLAPEAAQALIQATFQAQKPAYDLTAREHDVLGCMVDGLSNAEIGQRLVISESTVKFHVSNILNKLQAASRTEAVSIALQEGLVAQGRAH
jgi:two-component system, NarL family, response regulator LiaR